MLNEIWIKIIPRLDSFENDIIYTDKFYNTIPEYKRVLVKTTEHFFGLITKKHYKNIKLTKQERDKLIKSNKKQIFKHFN